MSKTDLKTLLPPFLVVLALGIGTAWILAHPGTDEATEPAAAAPVEVALTTELHAVGVYEGYDSESIKKTGPNAKVIVDRPGKGVVLFLGSVEPVTWDLQIGSETTIKRVILGGSSGQSVRGLPSESPVSEAFLDSSTAYALPSAYERDGTAFRDLARSLVKYTGMELSSFRGKYRASPDPFVIDAVATGPGLERLSTSYPRPAAPDSLPHITYTAPMLSHGRDASPAAYATFAWDGSVVGPLTSLPIGIQALAFYPDRKQFYGLKGQQVVRFGSSAKSPVSMRVGDDVPELSWPCGIAFDSKRNRVMLASLGGEGFLYAYDTVSETWSVVMSMEQLDLFALAYSASRDSLFGLASGRGDTVRLIEFSPDGAVIQEFGLADPVLPGMISDRVTSGAVQLVATDSYLVIIARETFRKSETVIRTFFVNPETGKAVLANVR